MHWLTKLIQNLCRSLIGIRDNSRLPNSDSRPATPAQRERRPLLEKLSPRIVLAGIPENEAWLNVAPAGTLIEYDFDRI
jgi:hypothetical protein